MFKLLELLIIESISRRFKYTFKEHQEFLRAKAYYMKRNSS
jgi:hypothetical protein